MGNRSHPSPTVYLIGGAPGAGKTTLATALAVRLGISAIDIDDLVTAVQAVTTPDSHPGLHLMWQRSHLDYFTHSTVNQLIKDAQNQHRAAWPSILAVVRKHARLKGPIVINGWHLWPERVAELQFENIWAGWIHIDPAVLRRREEENGDWLEGSADPDKMLANFMGRSLWFNEFYKREAAAHGFAILPQDGRQSVDDLCDLLLNHSGHV